MNDLSLSDRCDESERRVNCSQDIHKKRQCSSQNVFNDTNNNRLTTNVKSLSHNSTPVRRVQKCCIRKLKNRPGNFSDRASQVHDRYDYVFLCSIGSSHTAHTWELWSAASDTENMCHNLHSVENISYVAKRRRRKKHNKKGKMRHLESH